MLVSMPSTPRLHTHSSRALYSRFADGRALEKVEAHALDAEAVLLERQVIRIVAEWLLNLERHHLEVDEEEADEGHGL